MATTLVAPVPVLQGPRLWTIEEYDGLPDDLLAEGENVELIEGLIYTKMGQNDPYITALRAVFAALQNSFGHEFNLSMQLPLKLGTHTNPEPDLYVLRGTWRDYDGRRPDPVRDVALVVEVSDTSLLEDQTRKARLYAKHGIPEYWIVNLQDRTLDVRRGARPQYEDYFETLVFHEGEVVAVSSGTVAVDDVLPKP